MAEQLKLPITKWIEDMAAAQLMKERGWTRAQVEHMWQEQERKIKEYEAKRHRYTPLNVSTRSQVANPRIGHNAAGGKATMPTGQAKAKVTGYTPGMPPPTDPAPPDGTYTLTMEKLGKPGKAGWKPGGSGWPSRMTFWVVDGITDDDGKVYVIPAWFTSSPDAITMFINAMISFGYTEPIEFKPLPERKNGDPRLDQLIEKIDSVLSWVAENAEAVHPRVTITTEARTGRSFSKIEWLPPEDYEGTPQAVETSADETETPAEGAEEVPAEGEEVPAEEEVPVEEEAPEPPPPPRRPAPVAAKAPVKAPVKVAAKPGAAKVTVPVKKLAAPAKPPVRKK